MSHVCTKDDPWSPEKSKRAVHPDAREVSAHYDWSAFHHDYVTMKCPWCGKEFESELPN